MLPLRPRRGNPLRSGTFLSQTSAYLIHGARGAGRILLAGVAVFKPAGGLGCQSPAQAIPASSVAARFAEAAPTAPILRSWGAQSRPRCTPGRTQQPRSRRPRQQASPKPRVWQDATGRSAILILSLRSRSASAARSVVMPASAGSRVFRSPWEHLG
ncbi:hypothetical protein NDU88_001738 [Pleurodeles waltl]|uniref:Uncharacterized protein n=1 Tax=Pleurodeles waltl TaxID=8319 RepID=A0AAV7U7A5_PLEWA|nr:hypothetical protein NDU88_001738 [Pleurodeles waltl]